MYLPAVIVAAIGLGIAAYAAMETAVEERRRRAAIGLCGLTIVAIGVMLI